MTESGDIGTDVAQFLELIERDRSERCSKILADAETQAQQIVRAARREATGRFKLALREERERSRLRVEAARAELATTERQQDHELVRVTLARGWDRVRVELVQRWQAPDSRARWMRALFERALDILPAASWRIEHPAGFCTSELDGFVPRIAERSGSRPDLLENRKIEAGLAIVSQGVRLDATLDGLLADRAAVEGRLLVELVLELPKPGGEA
jgi:hypothetical protein